ncbi:MAG: transaldolase [Planctomycetota bacterium]|nr:transaldolase [Planctomycetota bacterium]
MNAPLQSLIATGTKLYLDSIDPVLVAQNIEWGAVGATSNPIIVAGLLDTGRFDDAIVKLMDQGLDDSTVAWAVTDQIVQDAQNAFHATWKKSGGDDGWVSFELDPLLEDTERNLPHNDRVEQYIELGRKWSAGHDNRMIKVPATPAGLEAAETLSADGITLNVTLIFSDRQYRIARDNVWAGAKRRKSLDTFKSVYSIFVSRIDQFTAKFAPQLSSEAQGLYGIVNAKRLWMANQAFWGANKTPLKQEIIFASTGTKNPSDPAWKYVAALAGSDIQTNPPATNDAVSKSTETFTRQVDVMPSAAILAELDAAVSVAKLEEFLMDEGLSKFATPQKQLLGKIAEKRASLVK